MREHITVLCWLAIAPVALADEHCGSTARQSALALHEKAESVDHELEALRAFRMIADRCGSDWLASYWSSYLATQISAHGDRPDFPADLDTVALLELAHAYLDEAASRIDSVTPGIESDLHALRGLIHWFEHRRAPNQEGRDEALARMEDEFRMAVRLNSESPVMVAIAAVEMVRDGATYGDFFAAKVMFDWAAQEFQRHADRSQTTHFNEEWLLFWEPEVRRRLGEFLEE